jgi:ribosomal protein L37AE/L43A
MGAKTKKIKFAGRFRSGIGARVRKDFNAIEATQRKKHASPFSEKGIAKRIAAGIWKCSRTGKIFAGPAYSLEEKE